MAQRLTSRKRSECSLFVLIARAHCCGQLSISQAFAIFSANKAFFHNNRNSLMARMTVDYQGGLRCQLTHESSQTVISTDAPVDNKGRGESFSPTDLVAAGLASCMLTTIAIVAENTNHPIPLQGTTASVTKEMVSNPRRIGKLTVEIDIPHTLSDKDLQFVENVAKTCPVHRSLHPEVQIDLSIRSR
jgi:putative redox protein